MNHLLITADGVCDLPTSYIKEHEFDILWSYVNVDTGTFLDRWEITASNVIEYYETQHKKATTSPPSVDEYAEFFRKRLETNDVILHISITSAMSDGYNRALQAKKQLGANGDRVFVVDSMSVSVGMAILITKALELKKEGQSASEIQAYLNEYRHKVSLSLLISNLDYMLINGQVNERMAKRTKILKFRPVLKMVDGKFKMKIIAGISMPRYVKNMFKNPEKIDRSLLYIAHAGLAANEIEYVRKEILKICEFDNTIVIETSAAVTSSCGPGSVGLSFAYK